MLHGDTLVDVVRAHAERAPPTHGLTFLDDDGVEIARLSWADLDRRARAIAARLQATHRPGDRALLLFAPSLDFVSTFFATLYAGIVAVPVYPPDPVRLERTLPRLLGIAGDCEPAIVLSTRDIVDMAKETLSAAPELASAAWLATDEVTDADAAAWSMPPIERSTLAFLQYTSGSTGSPKGVMVTHENLLANEAMITEMFEFGPSSIFVSWLPLYHDMGLIGNLMQPLFHGGRCVLMSPVSFLKQPRRWLQAMSRYRATSTTAPNFAYDLAVRKVSEEDKRELDLSSWSGALNGAEPVRADTLERFAAAFAPCGFRREAFFPCYGMAEATLAISGGKRERVPTIIEVDDAAMLARRVTPAPPGQGTRLVGCGRPPHDLEVVIVDADSGAPCDGTHIGEIWLRGKSVAAGYWRREELSAHTFSGRLADGRGPFLRTGDLGFLQDGEVFPTGRLKDILIIRGRNHYPQDIERTAEEAHPSLRAGCAAAFSAFVDGEERVVIVAEVERRFSEAGALAVDEVVRLIRRQVVEVHGMQPHAVVLLKAGSIPKTSSGKLQRFACRAAWLEGTLEALVLESAA